MDAGYAVDGDRRRGGASTFTPDADFEKYRGRLAGKIVLTQPLPAT